MRCGFFLFVAGCTVCAGASTVGGCENKRAKKQDFCTAFVSRQISCLKRIESAEKNAPNVQTGFVLEKALLEKRTAVKRCRTIIDGSKRLQIALQKCLRRSSCQRFHACYQDVFVIERAERALAEMKKTENRESPAAQAVSVCRSGYVLRRLGRINHPKAVRLAEKLKDLCTKQRGAAVLSAERRLADMVEKETLHGIGDLCRSFLAQRTSGKAPRDRKHIALPPRLKRRAVSLQKLCRDRWRMISVQRRINRIKRLERKKAVEKILRLCRRHKRFCRELYRTGQKAAAELAGRFERVCKHDALLNWLRKRLVDWRAKAGPQTCRRAHGMCEALEERYPHDPMVHVSQAWFREVCGKYFKHQP